MAASGGPLRPLVPILLLACAREPASPCEAAGPQVDVAGEARLWATGTRGQGEVLPPREETDGVGTIRDGRPTTGWVPPLGEPATLTLDLAGLQDGVDVEALVRRDDPSLAAAQLPLGVLSIAGVDLPEVTAVVRRWAGGPEVARATLVADQPLDLDGACGRTVELTLTARDGTRVTGLSLTAPEPQRWPRDALAPSDRRHRRSGVVEGFYGTPWSWTERHRIVQTLGELGMGRYVLSPKDEATLREAWRTPWTPSEERALSDLATTATAADVDLFVGLSPFLDFGAEPGDLDTLVAKASEAVRAGAHGILLAADDIELTVDVTVDADLAAEHVAVANDLLDALRDVSPEAALLFVGTVYSDERRDDLPGGAAYLEALDALHEDVEVLWTGPSTFSPSLSGDDLVPIEVQLGRPVGLWDNLWANDGGDGLIGRIFASHYADRSRNLPENARGILVNPGIQGGITRTILPSFGAWLDANPWEERVARLAGRVGTPLAEGEQDPLPEPFAVELMTIFADHANRTPDWPPLTGAIDALEAAIARGDDPQPAMAGVQRQLMILLGLPSRLHHSRLDSRAVDDWLPVAEAGARWGRRGLYLLDRITAVRQGSPGDALLEQADAALRPPTRYQLGLAAIDRLEGLAELARPGGAPAARAQPAPLCDDAATWWWKPFPDAQTLTVSGPGLMVEDGRIRLDPLPPGPRTVAAAADGLGWAELTLYCPPPSPDASSDSTSSGG